MCELECVIGILHTRLGLRNGILFSVIQVLDNIRINLFSVSR